MSITSPLLDRVAAAPISWGVCEVPDWGIQLPVETVLGEMAELGFTHTELGAIGYLPTDPVALVEVLELNGLQLLGGFVPVVLHDADRMEDSLVMARDSAGMLSSAGATFFVTAVIADPSHWHRVELTKTEWKHLVGGIEEIERICADHDLTQVVHPHVDTLIENVADVDRLLADTDAAICLDTGHLVVGGADPLALSLHASDRIGLVHLKDIDADVAGRLRRGELSLMESVQRGIFPPLGRGSVPITEIVTALELTGRDLWYVLEQDTAITDGDTSALVSPKLDLCASIEFLRGVDVDSSTPPLLEDTTREG